ncbi:MAG: 4Fe-4S dicluster domain-containing protein [Thermodesulfobacteriota bacterium]
MRRASGKGDLMADKLILYKEHLNSFLRKITKGFELIAPVRNTYGDTLFEVISSVDDAHIDLTDRPILSPKRFFMPQVETLFAYRYDKSGYTFKNAADNTPRVIFGLRSCDTRGILFYDLIFQEGLKDKYYLERRKNTILINLGCNQPGENCFCKSAQSGPFLTYGYDIQLTDLGDRFFVEIGRPRGRELLAGWSYFFRPATQTDIDAQYEAVLESEGKFRHRLDFDAAIEKLINQEVDPAVWEEMGSRCQNCGGCAYVCPTCYCFNIFDSPSSEKEGERIRTWDACTFAGFSRLAGGYNPRQDKAQRIKRRFYHKLFYDKQKYSIPSCVGCGRCADICFGRIDMLSFIRLICEQKERALAPAHRRLGELLLEAGIISRKDLDLAIEKQATTGKPLGAQLVEMGMVDKEAIARALGCQLKIPGTAENIED